MTTRVKPIDHRGVETAFGHTVQMMAGTIGKEQMSTPMSRRM